MVSHQMIAFCSFILDRCECACVFNCNRKAIYSIIKPFTCGHNPKTLYAKSDFVCVCVWHKSQWSQFISRNQFTNCLKNNLFRLNFQLIASRISLTFWRLIRFLIWNERRKKKKITLVWKFWKSGDFIYIEMYLYCAPWHLRE